MSSEPISPCPYPPDFLADLPDFRAHALKLVRSERQKVAQVLDQAECDAREAGNTAWVEEIGRDRQRLDKALDPLVPWIESPGFVDHAAQLWRDYRLRSMESMIEGMPRLVATFKQLQEEKTRLEAALQDQDRRDGAIAQKTALEVVKTLEHLPRAPENGGGADDPNFRPSDDYRSVVWSGTPYTFTKNQAACVKVLWAAWRAQTPELDGLTVVTQAEVAQNRLIDVFRSKGKMHPAWGTMIVQGRSKGAYRLSDGPTATPPKPRRRQSRKTTRKTHR